MKGHTILLITLGYLTLVIGCDECGDECRKMCGTKQFKTCCFNYLKKRSLPPETGPDLRLEVSLAKNRQRGELPPYLAYLAPLFQYSPAIYSNLRNNARNIDLDDQGTLQLLYDASISQIFYLMENMMTFLSGLTMSIVTGLSTHLEEDKISKWIIMAGMMHFKIWIF